MPRKGPAYLITPDWRKAVLERMVAKGWNKAELARQLGCSRTAVTDMLTDGQTSTLVPEVEKSLGLPISMINIGAESGLHQHVGPTAERLRRPLGWNTPIPSSELHDPVTPIPRPVDAPDPQPKSREEFVLSSDASMHVLQLFNELNTRNRVNALEWLNALVVEQDYVERIIAERVRQERDREVERELNQAIASYLKTGTHRFEGDTLRYLHMIVASETVAELGRVIVDGERYKPAKGTESYAKVVEVYRLHKASLETSGKKRK
jgi:hypothetical protein